MLRQVRKILEFLSLISLLVLFLLLGLTVLLRNIFGIGFFWINEVLSFCQMNMTYFMLPVLFLTNEHMRVDFLVNKASPAFKKVFDCFTILVALAFSFSFLYSQYVYFKRSWDISTPILGMPNIIFYSGSLIGVFLLALFSIGTFFKREEN